MSTRHVLITGGTGFIGWHLARMLLDHGDRVTLAARSRHALRPPDPRARDLTVDLRTADLDMLLDGVDAVAHLAWSSTPSTSAGDAAGDILANALPTVRLAEAALRARVCAFVFVSSGGAIYGDSQGRALAEDALARPMSPYGVSKLTSESYLAYFHDYHGLRATVLRPSNAYGPGQDPRGGLGAVTAFTWRTLIGRPVEIWGDGSVTRDYIAATDLCRAILAALDAPASGPGHLPIFNISSGQPLSLNCLLEKVFGVLGRTVPVTYRAGRPFDVPCIALDNARARSLLRWEPRVRLEDGIAELAAWFAHSPSLSGELAGGLR